jgi:hypothetical protein
MIGVIQEQHAERCQLFAQWKNFDWPIVRDPVNRLGLTAVPIVVELDEAGVVKSVGPSVDSVLASLSSSKQPAINSKEQGERPKSPRIADLRREATESNTSEAWIELGDALVLWGDKASPTDAITAYKKAMDVEPDNARIHFRLGVAYRMRHDSSSTPATTHANDFQSAVDSWGKALDLEPNQYIYRRRIQQYGPRLIKPYPFYDWVELARKEIVARGESPIELSVEPSGAEIASPTKRFVATAEERQAPDPKGRINRDTRRLIQANAVVVPGTVRPGESVRVHIELSPQRNAHWNNESDPLVLWLQLPERWQSERQWFASAVPETAESSETRSLEFEIKPAASQTESVTLKAYALYYVCESSRGTCLYLRQDIEIPIKISASQ